MRTAVILGVNLVVAVVGLGALLWFHGATALALLTRAPSVPLLCAFALAVLGGVAGLAWRWKIVLAGLGRAPGLAFLTACRAAGQSVSTLVPSAKLAGEPLRAYLLVPRVSGPHAVASVAVDRVLEAGSGMIYACAFATILLQHGVPGLQQAFVTVAIGTLALAVGVVVTTRQLRNGRGIVSALLRGARLDRLRVVERQLGNIGAAEDAAVVVIDQRRRLAGAFAASIVANGIVLLEYWLLLTAFGLPASPVSVVAAIFATGAAHSLPVPAGIGVLEGGQMWIFSLLGHPPDVGLAVGLAVRLRELLWVVPGLVYLGLRLASPQIRP